MADYLATNNLTDMVETNPTGAELPSKIDDAFRETRTVMKNVIQKIHSSLGELKVAIWAEQFSYASGFGTPTANTNAWVRRRIHAATGGSLVELSDTTGITAAGATGSTIVPVLGTYLVIAWAKGGTLEDTQLGLAKVTSDTTTVANGDVVISGSYASSSSAAYGGTENILFGVLSANGTDAFGLVQIYGQAETVRGFSGNKANALTNTLTPKCGYIVFIKVA